MVEPEKVNSILNKLLVQMEVMSGIQVKSHKALTLSLKKKIRSMSLVMKLKSEALKECHWKKLMNMMGVIYLFYFFILFTFV